MECSRPTPLYFRQLARAPLVQSALEPAVLPGCPCIKHPKNPWPLPTLFPFTRPGGYFLCGVHWGTPIHSGLNSNHMARAPPVLSIQGHSAFTHFRWPVRAPSEWRAPGQGSLQSLQLQLFCQDRLCTKSSETTLAHTHFRFSCLVRVYPTQSAPGPPVCTLPQL